MLLFSTQMSFNGNKQINSCSQFIHRNASAENIFDDVSADTDTPGEKNKGKRLHMFDNVSVATGSFFFLFSFKGGRGNK